MDSTGVAAALAQQSDLCDGTWTSDDLEDLQDILDSLQSTGSPPDGSDDDCADVNNDTFLTRDDYDCLTGLLGGMYKSTRKCPDCQQSAFEICHDGIDNDCDGQTDSELRRESDACVCSELTLCDMGYDSDGIPGFSNSTDERLCRDMGEGFKWVTKRKWDATCGASGDAGNRAYCGNREYICTDKLKWEKCGPTTGCDSTITAGKETYWCRNINNTGWKWHKCPQCNSEATCKGSGASREKYTTGTEMLCEDKLLSCTASGWEKYPCNANVDCNDTLVFGGKEYWCRNMNDEGWGWTACPKCKKMGCEGVPSGRCESYGGDDIMACGGDTYYCTPNGWKKPLQGTFSYYTDPGPSIDGVWISPPIPDRTLWGPVGDSEESGAQPKWRIAQWGWTGSENGPLPYTLTSASLREGQGNCIGAADWRLVNKSVRVCWVPMNDGTYQAEVYHDGTDLPCGVEYDIFISPVTKNYPDYPPGFISQDESPPLSELSSLRYEFAASLKSSHVGRAGCHTNQRQVIASVVLNNPFNSQTLFYQINLDKRSHTSWFFKTAPKFGSSVSIEDYDEPQISSSRHEYSFDMLPLMKRVIQQGPSGMDKDLSHWRVTSAYIGGAVWGDSSHTFIFDHMNLVGKTK